MSMLSAERDPVNKLTEALEEYLTSVGKEKNLRKVVNELRLATRSSEDEIAIAVIGAAYDKLAYGN